jgi:hypothetical protein
MLHAKKINPVLRLTGTIQLSLGVPHESIDNINENFPRAFQSDSVGFDDLAIRRPVF